MRTLGGTRFALPKSLMENRSLPAIKLRFTPTKPNNKTRSAPANQREQTFYYLNI